MASPGGRGTRAAGGEGAASPPRVLIVDDDRDVLRGYAYSLRKAGFETRAAADGQQALEVLRSEAVHVVVSDIAMPRMDGIALLKAVREQHRALPVVLVTGGAQLGTALEAIEHGAISYLEKPVDPTRLCQAVQRAVARGRMDTEASGLLEMGGRMDAALASMWMAFQPIVSWRRRELFGYEALLRSEEPSLSRPCDLVSAAETLGRVHELGRAVRAQVAGRIDGLPEGLTAFVNLHPLDLEDHELHDPRSPLAGVARRVVLEITERATLESIDAPRDRIESLRRLGFRIAIDDLGAGYAGLSSIALLEPEFVKIDMSLVRDVHVLPRSRTLVRALLGACQELGIGAVAEGVETSEERDALAGLGCDLLQGFLFGRPAREFESPHGWDPRAATGEPGRCHPCDGDAAPTEGESRTKACVLVVEDDADIRQLIADSLCEAGYRVVQAVDGREALALAAGERPSLIVTDLKMSGMNGWELLRALRADASLSEIPVIVASASEEVPAEVSAQVAKPFRPESLLAAVQTVVNRH